MDKEDFWNMIRAAVGIALVMGVFMLLEFGQTALNRYQGDESITQPKLGGDQ